MSEALAVRGRAPLLLPLLAMLLAASGNTDAGDTDAVPRNMGNGHEELDAALEHGSASPSVVKYRCMGVDGCTWSDGDGTPRGGYVGGGTF